MSCSARLVSSTTHASPNIIVVFIIIIIRFGLRCELLCPFGYINHTCLTQPIGSACQCPNDLYICDLALGCICPQVKVAVKARIRIKVKVKVKINVDINEKINVKVKVKVHLPAGGGLRAGGDQPGGGARSSLLLPLIL